MCKYSDDSGYECPHKKLEDSDYCIFHLQDGNKNVDEFNKGIKEILETEEDSIYLTGFYFPQESSDFSAKKFQKKIDFFNVIFSGKTDFMNAEFSKANFRNAEFSEKANFMNAKFLEADFRNAEFSEANFMKAKFSKVNFMKAKFSEANFMNAKFLEADFNDAEFSKEANFMNAKFSKADFNGAKFSEANFMNAKFSKADFNGAKLSEKANFMNAKFSKADFNDAEFSKVNFMNAKFLEADFNDAEFSKVNFMNAEFSKIDFWNAKFSKADFNGAEFSEEADFNGAEFSKEANFKDAEFSKEANFKDAELTGKFKFIPDKSETIIFENTYFSDNVRIKADMSKCSFANSNIERVDITDSIWIVDNKPKDSYKIWEERQGELSSNWKELEGIYRRLKQSSQKFGDNDTAGKFYYQEMECKRKQLNVFNRVFKYLFYKKLCGHGEKPFNVIWASILIILASSLFFFYHGIELLGSEVLNFSPRLIDYNLSSNFQWAIININQVIGDWLICLYTSVITFTTLGYGDVHPIGWSRVVASVEAGIGIIMTALFIFVFTRKMLR